MVTVRAPAKINLYLHVTGRRADGYHELVTRMQTLTLGDEIDLNLHQYPGVECCCDDPGLPCDRANLAVLAAERFLLAAGLSQRFGVGLTIRKYIPLAAGLGGGSSDAGAVLRGLNSLVPESLDEPDLISLARELGADVPFFASGMTAAVATGVGERLQPAADVSDFLVLLINPGFGVSTRWVFENYALTTAAKKSKFRGSHVDDGDRFVPAMLHNDLEQVTMSRYPAVAAIKESLIEAGAGGALMTGSGPTVFGLFAKQLHTKESLNRTAELITKKFGGRAFVTRPDSGA